jgi:hypothetical protein
LLNIGERLNKKIKVVFLEFKIDLGRAITWVRYLANVPQRPHEASGTADEGGYQWCASFSVLEAGGEGHQRYYRMVDAQNKKK